jgi:HEPN domain-containing protein
MRRAVRTDYYSASLERLEESRRLLEARSYAGSIYLSGLAAESIIKAFIDRNSAEIKGHNLARLSIAANMGRRLNKPVRAKVEAAITEAAPLWRNLFRYSSGLELDRMGKEFQLRFEVNGRLTRYSGLGDDRLRLWSERMYNLAALIVQEGRLLWLSSKH